MQPYPPPSTTKKTEGREGGYGRLSWTITLVVKDCVAYQIPCVMNAGPQSYKREEKLIYLYWLALWRHFPSNRPLALRGHLTNASFKQWVRILLMPKIDRAHKNYLTPKIWEEMHLREIFYGTLIFQQSSMICIGRHVGGHTLILQHGGQNYFLLISC